MEKSSATRCSKPGEWYAKRHWSGGQALVIDEADGRTVAVAYDEKDADVLAASRDLLTAAECALWSLEATGRDVCDDGTPTKPARLLRAAINKAKGE